MTRWMYQEPGNGPGGTDTYVLTEDDILNKYWGDWVDRMIKVGKAHLISEKRCIEDWVTVHWAWRVDDDD